MSKRKRVVTDIYFNREEQRIIGAMLGRSIMAIKPGLSDEQETALILSFEELLNQYVESTRGFRKLFSDDWREKGYMQPS